MQTLLNRRAMLSLTSLAAVVPLTDCASVLSNPTALTQLQVYVQTASTAAQQIWTDIEVMSTIPAATEAKISAAINTIISAGTQIVNNLTPQSSLVVEFTKAIQLLGQLLTPFFPAASLIGTVLVSMISLIQPILIQAGVTGGAVLAHAPAPRYTADQAVANLRAYNALHE